MNLPKFLKEVDRLAGGMSAEELASFVHEMARIHPEEKRAEFLHSLEKMRGDAGTDIAPSNSEGAASNSEGAASDAGFTSSGNGGGEGLLEKCDRVVEKLLAIDEGDLCLNSTYNDEYDDWNYRGEEEFLYKDPDGVLDVLEEACELVHQCVDCEEYKAGYELAELLSRLEITVSGDYADCFGEPMSVSELKEHGIGSLDYRKLSVESAYLAYCANALPKRAEALYRMLESQEGCKVTLEEVMQCGEELPEIDEFLKLWIAYLGHQTSYRAGRLLGEAVELADDPGQLLESARKYCALHPELYEKYILLGRHREDDMALLEVGWEALHAIDIKYVVRSRVALLMSTLALGHGMRQEAERCWLEAFRSDTRVVNYLRLLVECRDFSEVKEDARAIYHGMYSQIERKEDYSYFSAVLRENRAGEANIYMIAFLGGEFPFVKDKAMKKKTALGWTTTFMKCGLAAFLMLLYEGKDMQQGIRVMCNKVIDAVGFDKEEYRQGLPAETMDGGSGQARAEGNGSTDGACQLAASVDGGSVQELAEGNGGTDGACQPVPDMWRNAGSSSPNCNNAGAQAAVAEENTEMFWRCFLRFKEMVPLSEEEKQGYLRWVEGLVSKRTKGIIEGNHRNYYGECAGFIAALGEVKESRGEADGRQKMLLHYKAQFPRRSAFHQELRGFGMKDSKRKKGTV